MNLFCFVVLCWVNFGKKKIVETLAVTRMEQPGQLGSIAPGVKVYRESASIMSNALKVRPEGFTGTVWGSIDFVEYK